ncbi:hypothetical protein ACFQXA_04855 [Nocardiopsis composta]
MLPGTAAKAAALAAAAAVAAGFVLHERRSGPRVFPRATYRPGSPLKWVYLTIGLLTFGVAVESFLPLFGRRLGGLPPLAAGFFAAAVSSAGRPPRSAAPRRSGRARSAASAPADRSCSRWASSPWGCCSARRRRSGWRWPGPRCCSPPARESASPTRTWRWPRCPPSRTRRRGGGRPRRSPR